MKRFLIFQKVSPSNMSRDGEICIAIDGIVALESNAGTGDQLTTVTLDGGRIIHVEGSLQKVKARVGSAKKHRRPDPLSETDKMFGRGFMRDFFGQTRAWPGA